MTTADPTITRDPAPGRTVSIISLSWSFTSLDYLGRSHRFASAFRRLDGSGSIVTTYDDRSISMTLGVTNVRQFSDAVRSAVAAAPLAVPVKSLADPTVDLIDELLDYALVAAIAAGLDVADVAAISGGYSTGTTAGVLEPGAESPF